jgi:hypothetical protein
MVVTRTFDGLVWEAISPSRYVLTGYGLVETYYDGACWKLQTCPTLNFDSMEAVSQLVRDTIEWMVSENLLDIKQ